MGFWSRLFGKDEETDENMTGLEQAPAEKPFPEEDLGLNESSDMGLHEKPIIPEMSREPSQDLTESTTQMTTRPQISSRDIDLLNSKLDTLKAILNSMDQRIANLERAAGVEQKRMPW